MTPLERITEQVNRHGDVNDWANARPLLGLDEFFQGNNAVGSICCNCSPTPSPQKMYEFFKRIRSRSDVAAVRVQITMFDDPRWPFSDTVWIITSAAPDEVMSWFEESFAPDECNVGWPEGGSAESLNVPAGMHPVACWWD